MNYFKSLAVVHTMAAMKLKSEASRLWLSYFWWVLEPILFVVVFYVVFEIILNMGRGDFIAFLMVGKIPFLWFSKTLNSSAGSLMQNKGLIGQRDFSKYLFPYAVILENLYKQLLVFAVLLALLLIRGYEPSVTWFYLPLIAFVNLMLVIPLGMLGAWLVVYAQDVKLLIQMGTTFLLFSSGIFWDVRAIADVQAQNLILTLNPMAFLIDAYRQALMFNSAPDLVHLFYLAVASIAAIFLMHLLYKTQSKAIALKVIS